MSDKLDIGDILGRAWTNFQRSWQTLVPIALIWSLITGLAVGLLFVLAVGGGGGLGAVRGDLSDGLSGAIIGAIIAVPVAILIVVIVSVLQSTMLVKAAGDFEDGGSPSVGEAWGGAGSFSDYIPTAVRLALIAMGLGLLAVVSIITIIGPLVVGIFAIWLFVRWSMTVPVMLYERRFGQDAMNRSKELVQPLFWPVLGTLVVTSIVVGIVVSILQQVVTAAIPGTNTLMTLIEGTLSFALNGLSTAAVAIVTLLIYRQLAGVATDGGTAAVTPPPAAPAVEAPASVVPPVSAPVADPIPVEPATDPEPETQWGVGGSDGDDDAPPPPPASV